MFKFVMAAILIVSIRALAGEELSGAKLLLNEAKADPSKKERTYKYLKVVNFVSKEEAKKKGEHVINEENISDIFHKAGNTDLEIDVLNRILTKYAMLVRNGENTGEITLHRAVEALIKDNNPGITEAKLMEHLDAFDVATSFKIKKETASLKSEILQISNSTR